VLSEHGIWEIAFEVWTELPNAKIASGFIQAHAVFQHRLTRQGVTTNSSALVAHRMLEFGKISTRPMMA
jgi:hypothetical protein